MAKINNRKHVPQHPPAHMGGPTGAAPSGGMPTGNHVAQPAVQRGQMGMNGQLHHHHAHPDGSASGGADDVSGMF